MAVLEARHFSELTFQEVSRALRAVSSIYVERRHRIAEGGVLSGTGKRAAFALFYGPLHYLLVRSIVNALPGAADVSTLIDLGCGTGAAGAAWAQSCRERGPVVGPVIGIDRHPWAVQEAARTYRDFGLQGRTRRADITTAVLPRDRAAIVAAFTMNELPHVERDALLEKLVDRARGGDQLLIVEPLAGFVAPWWTKWRTRIERAGGRADEWRFRPALPPIIAKLDHAAGLDHRELSGRSLWLSTRAADRAASS
jgi:SAM-dependent methyltransferase